MAKSSGAKAAEAAAESAEKQAEIQATVGAATPAEAEAAKEAAKVGGTNATGIPEEDMPEGPPTKLEGQEALVPADTKARKKVGVARRSINTWWCDNCDTGNVLAQGGEKATCGGCGGVADLTK